MCSVVLTYQRNPLLSSLRLKSGDFFVSDGMQAPFGKLRCIRILKSDKVYNKFLLTNSL